MSDPSESRSADATSGLGPRAERRLLWLAVSLPLIRFAVDAARGLDYLHFQYLVDDAFYYFVIARHLPFFNPGVASSGFHPLYAVLASLFHGTLAPGSAVVACLLLLACANAACVWVLHACLRRLFPEPVPLLCAFGWATSTKIHALAMTGVETILAVLAVLICAERFLRLYQGQRWSDRRAMAALGLWMGVAFWARMDAPLLLAPFALYAFVRGLRSERPAAAIGLAAWASLLPLLWIGAIELLTGSPFPTSGAALRVLRDGGLLTGLAAAAQTARTPLSYLDQFLAGGALSLEAAAALVGGAVLLFWRRRGRSAAAFGPFAALLLLGLALWAGFYVFYLKGFRSWYGLYLALPVYALALPVVVSVLLSYLPSRAVGVTTAAALAVSLSALSTGGPIAKQEYDKYRAALAANAHLRGLDPSVRVGSFNAGVYNFYTDREVWNLDGVVNPEAMRAQRDGTLADYMRRSNIRVLIEHEPARTATFRRVFGSREVHFERWIELSREYPPYPGQAGPAKRTWLWRVSYPGDAAGKEP